MAAAFRRGSLWLLLSSRLDAKAIIAAALLAALALLTTIKVVFYAPAFAVVACLRWREAEQPRNMMRRLLVLAVAASLLGLLFVVETIYRLPDMTHAPGGSAAHPLRLDGRR